MAKLKVAIACQGGGSQTAFTAGALKALCQEQVAEEFDFVSISGTSGGALCATLIWYAAMKGERPLWGRMIKFWEENTAQGPAEHAINHGDAVERHGETVALGAWFRRHLALECADHAVSQPQIGLRTDVIEAR